jgi:hypothetical protein
LCDSNVQKLIQNSSLTIILIQDEMGGLVCFDGK